VFSGEGRKGAWLRGRSRGGPEGAGRRRTYTYYGGPEKGRGGGGTHMYTGEGRRKGVVEEAPGEGRRGRGERGHESCLSLYIACAGAHRLIWVSLNPLGLPRGSSWPP